MKVLIVGGVPAGLGVALAGIIEEEYSIRPRKKRKKHHDEMKKVRGHCYPWYKKVK